MLPFSDAVSVLNDVYNWLFLTKVTNSVDIISFILFVACIGWIIHSLANKEA